MYDPEYLYQITDEQQDDTTALDIILLGLLIKYMRNTLKDQNYLKARVKAIKDIAEEAQAQVSKYNLRLVKTNKKLFQEGFKESIEEEITQLQKAAEELNTPPPTPLKENKEVKEILDKGYRKTNATIRNYTKTTAKITQLDFIERLDEAFIKLQSSTNTLDEVMFDTLKDLARKGVFRVEYPMKGGRARIDHADVALRRALVTGLNQTYAEATEMYAEQTNNNLVQVSQHQGAREGEGINNHKGWQGRVYSLKGSADKYPNLRTETGYGQGGGLCGWNCRHSFRIFIPGITEENEKLNENPDITYKGKTFTYYQATQEQRRMERQIRKYKREYYLCRQTSQPTAEVSKKINYWTNEVDQFSKQIGNPRRKEAERVVTKF